MEEVLGDAAFSSFPGERFRFGVGREDDVGKIWLESQASKKRWTCEMADVAAFAPPDVVLPANTVLHYVAASLKESATNASLGPKLLRDVEDQDETLQLEVLIKLGVADFAWAPKYVFPMKIEPQMATPPTELHSQQIKRLNDQVQELQEEVATLKEQMQLVLRSQPATQSAAVPTIASPVSASPSRRSTAPVVRQPANSTRKRATASSPSRSDQVWGDIIGQPQHQLVQIEEYRETQNSLGVTVRSHRQHTCKVCSMLRGDRRRPFCTSFYCAECTNHHDGGMVFLCDKVRPHDPREYRNATCSQIWHGMWNNGADIPENGVSSIRMRKRLKPSHSSEHEAT